MKSIIHSITALRETIRETEAAVYRKYFRLIIFSSISFFIIKVKNKYFKIYIREFNFTHDMLYYFYKIKTEKSLEIVRKFKKKTKNFYVLLVIRFLTFRFLDVIKIYSRLSGFNKFKSRYLKNNS